MAGESDGRRSNRVATEFKYANDFKKIFSPLHLSDAI